MKRQIRGVIAETGNPYLCKAAVSGSRHYHARNLLTPLGAN